MPVVDASDWMKTAPSWQDRRTQELAGLFKPSISERRLAMIREAREGKSTDRTKTEIMRKKKMAYGKSLRANRENAEMTREELAKKLGCNYYQIRCIEGGFGCPNPDLAVKIKFMFQMDWDEF